MFQDDGDTSYQSLPDDPRNHKEIVKSFPPPSASFQRLYGIYRRNDQLIERIVKRIKELQQCQRINERVEYDLQAKANEEFQQLYILDEQYEDSEFIKQYQLKMAVREEEIQAIEVKANRAHVIFIENMMNTVEATKELLRKYVVQHKRIVSLRCSANFIVVLSGETCQEREMLKVALVKLTRLMWSGQAKDVEGQTNLAEIDRLEKSVNTFFSQNQHRDTLTLQNCDRKYLEAHYDEFSREYLLVGVSSYVDVYTEQAKLRQTLAIDEGVKVAYLSAREKQLYLGTDDGVLRLYGRSNGGYSVLKVLGCFGSDTVETVGQYWVSPGNDIFFSLQKQVFMLSNYEITEVLVVPSKILRIVDNFILTEELVYVNFYSNGKFRLNCHEGLNKFYREHKIYANLHQFIKIVELKQVANQHEKKTYLLLTWREGGEVIMNYV